MLGGRDVGADALDGGGGVVAPAQRAGCRQRGILQHGVGGKCLRKCLSWATICAALSCFSERSRCCVSAVPARPRPGRWRRPARSRACPSAWFLCSAGQHQQLRLRLADPFGDGGVEGARVVGGGLQGDILRVGRVGQSIQAHVLPSRPSKHFAENRSTRCKPARARPSQRAGAAAAGSSFQLGNLDAACGR